SWKAHDRRGRNAPQLQGRTMSILHSKFGWFSDADGNSSQSDGSSWFDSGAQPLEIQPADPIAAPGAIGSFLHTADPLQGTGMGLPSIAAPTFSDVALSGNAGPNLLGTLPAVEQHIAFAPGVDHGFGS